MSKGKIVESVAHNELMKLQGNMLICSPFRVRNAKYKEWYIMIEMLKSKIHRATVTDANINYEGSITISSNLIKRANLSKYQKVLVVNVSNGSRFETYVIETNEDNIVCVNGAAARLVSVGDRIIIMSFCYLTELVDNYEPTVIHLNEKNEVI